MPCPKAFWDSFFRVLLAFEMESHKFICCLMRRSSSRSLPVISSSSSFMWMNSSRPGIFAFRLKKLKACLCLGPKISGN